jgi:hypothetical protein
MGGTAVAAAAMGSAATAKQIRPPANLRFQNLDPPHDTHVNVLASGGITYDALLPIPRHKTWISSDHQTLYCLIGGSTASVPNVMRSTDAGNTWSSLGTSTLNLNDHCNLRRDSADRLHFGCTGSGSGSGTHRSYLRWNGSAYDCSVEWEDFGAGNNAICSVLVDDSDGVWGFVRSSTDDKRVYYRYSSDHGVTWGTRGDVAQGVGLTRIHSMMLSGQPAVVVWDSPGTNRFRIFRWTGSAFAGIANNSLVPTATNELTRIFSMIQTDAEIIHAVWYDVVGGSSVIRHSYRTLSGAWSSAATVATLATYAHLQLTKRRNSVFLGYINNGDLSIVKWNGSAWGTSTSIYSSPNNVMSMSMPPSFDGDWVPIFWNDASYNIRFRALYDAV